MSFRFLAATANAAITAALLAAALHGQGAPDHPKVKVQGEDYTPRSILARNMGSVEDQSAQFPPHKIIGNIYYVGTKTLTSFLVVTPEGNILINTTYDRNVRTIQKSVEQLGFKFTDIKYILGNHAHGDHMEGDALAKELSGGQVVAMAQDEAALRAIKPGGREHPVDKVIKDGDKITLGGTTLTAHLTAGHTHGCTAWTTTVKEGGQDYNVVFWCSLRAPATISPEVEAEFVRSFNAVKMIPCDVPLGDHGAQFKFQEKYAKIKSGGPNPYIDPIGCHLEADVEEAMFHAVLAEQAAARK